MKTARGCLAALVVVLTLTGLDTSAAAELQLQQSASLSWDIVNARPSSERAQAAVTIVGQTLVVTFDVLQKEPIAASQETNGVGEGNDDEVWVDLWPAGISGYFYQFAATPRGTHYQKSSQNANYDPSWQAYGAIAKDGYTVTMRIPLSSMRGVSTHEWKLQFARYVHATGEVDVWSYDKTQTNADDFSRAGILHLPSQLAHKDLRRHTRVAVYWLSELAAHAQGGAKSRAGFDISIPIGASASLYSTFHPDYSNVELDQQSIAPSVYQRFYAETRPFFTEAASLYNNFTCNACSTITPLYTPAIPTPIEGYAAEGKLGSYAAAMFESLNAGRRDMAFTADYTSADTRWIVSSQRVAVRTPSLRDTTDTLGVQYTDLHHVSLYATYGKDVGTNVTDVARAKWYDIGGGWSNQTSGIYVAERSIGDFFNPVDGFVAHPGIGGYSVYGAKIWDLTGNSKIEAVGIDGFIDRYHGARGINQSDNSLLIDVLAKGGLDAQAFTGSNYWLIGDDLAPVSQSGGFALTLHGGSQPNNPANFPYHGSAPFPTTLVYNTGHYGAGRLHAWYRNSTMRLGDRGSLTLGLDDTRQTFSAGNANVQWLQSASFALQIDANSSLALGVRHVLGVPPTPNGGENCNGSCTNVTFAYHLRASHTEFYAAYGDPNALITLPRVVVKFIFYAGADKGT
jgi:hypothetical protein